MYRSRSRGVGSSSFRPRPPPPPGPPGPGEEGEGPWLGAGARRGRGRGSGVGSDLNRGRGTRGDEHMAGALEDTQLGIRWPWRVHFCGSEGQGAEIGASESLGRDHENIGETSAAVTAIWKSPPVTPHSLDTHWVG